MTTFPFHVNPSFRGYPSHPITIPKSHVSYRALEEELGSVREGRLEFPDQTVVPVVLNHSTAGFGEYYQLRTRKSAAWPTQACLGEMLDVRIALRGGQLHVALRAR